MLKSVSLLCEILSIIMLVHCFLHRKFSIRISTVVFVLFEVLGYWYIYKDRLPVYAQAVIYIGFIIYLWYEFRDEKVLKVIGTTFLSMFLVAGLQLAGYFLLFRLCEEEMSAQLSNLFIFGIILIAAHFVDFGKLYELIMKANKGILFISVLSIIVLMICVVLIKIIPGFSFLEALLMYVVFLVVLVFGQQWRAERERAIAKERENHLLTICRESFEQLITDVRSRQHEFDNQFDALCGLRFSCATLEEMNEKLNDALDFVYKENEYNRLLTSQCSPLIKGYLYANFCKASDYNIEVDYQIELSEDYPLTVEFDIQEIVGILFDNACEAMQKMEKPALSVRMKQADVNLTIQVENVSEYITQQEIQSFFKLTYSSKGNHRGYGLNNVKSIVEKYHGEIQTENIEKQGENWFSITVSLSNLNV